MLAALLPRADLALQGSQMALLIGPLIGGGLVRPIDRWPLLRPVKLLADYPYALPGLCLGGLALANAAVNAALLKEVCSVVMLLTISAEALKPE